ncbi:MAG TPA: pilus assembly protein TadG-related protein [Xanthobacteraceae bacterium]|nr:pilus assembly protein TadG-related protein [Xanthobacteraceae bacterium]
MFRPEFLRLLRQRLAAFRSAKGGNVAIIFGLTVIPLIGLVGAGVDYSRAARIQTILQAAADAAALGSVAQASPGYTYALSMPANGPVPIAQTEAVNIFNGEIAGRTGFTVANLTTTVTNSNWQLTSTVQFTATVPTVLMEILGWNTMTVTGTSVAANGLPTFMDFYLLLDNTPSMGLPATQTDITTLVNGTTKYASTNGLGCAFACHDIGTNQSNPNNSAFDNFYATAKTLGVTKRIDVMASAAAQMMTTAINSQTVNSQFRVAIYTFGTWGSTTPPSDVAKQASNNYAPNQVVALTTNLSAAATAAAQIDLMTVDVNNENNDRATDFDSMLPAISNLIPNPGTGASSTSRQALLFIVSDGMADEVAPANCFGNDISSQTRCIEPVNTALCTAIKNRGIRIAVLYTTYLTLPSSGPGSDSWSTSNVMPWVPDVAPAMQACASPGLYFQVTPTQGIGDAMNALFEQAIATARLTQ